jgi:hypothetical protein
MLVVSPEYFLESLDAVIDEGGVLKDAAIRVVLVRQIYVSQRFVQKEAEEVAAVSTLIRDEDQPVGH